MRTQNSDFLGGGQKQLINRKFIITTIGKPLKLNFTFSSINILWKVLYRLFFFLFSRLFKNIPHLFRSTETISFKHNGTDNLKILYYQFHFFKIQRQSSGIDNTQVALLLYGYSLLSETTCYDVY